MSSEERYHTRGVAIVFIGPARKIRLELEQGFNAEDFYVSLVKRINQVII